MNRWGVDSDMENLAAYVRMKGDDPSPGISFARSTLATAEKRKGKDDARSVILSRLSRDMHPGKLSILTLPGVTWRFEKSLLRIRKENVNPEPELTQITALEKDAPIYAASLAFIPGRDQGYVHVPGEVRCSAGSITTSKIHRYHCASFEDFAHEDETEYDAAWLDFTGPVSRTILPAIKALWPRVRDRLVVTSLKARWHRDVSASVTRAGGVTPLLNKMLPGSKVEKSIEYFDTVPMVQSHLQR
jgi:hypothetical protein